MTSGGIFKIGNSDYANCYVKEHHKGIYWAKFTTTEGRDLNCGKTGYETKFRYYPISDQTSETFTGGDNQYITNLPM